MIITLTGANDFLRSRELNELVAEFADRYGDLNLERLDGEEVSFERMQEAVQSLPFLAECKLVVLRSPGKQKTFSENIQRLLPTVPEATTVVIVEPKLDKRLSYYKTLKKETDFREFSELDVDGLTRWASKWTNEQQGQLTLSDARILIDRVGGNQQLLESELNKLLNYNAQITAETIELLTERLPQSTVFELLDAAFAGDPKRALALYREQRALRVEPQTIIDMLAWQLHVLALVKAAGTRSPAQIAGEAKINPFVVRKCQNLTRKLPLATLKTLVADLLLLDRRLKSTAVNADEALQNYLLQLS